jgi:hypothetical protein
MPKAPCIPKLLTPVRFVIAHVGQSCHIFFTPHPGRPFVLRRKGKFALMKKGIPVAHKPFEKRQKIPGYTVRSTKIMPLNPKVETPPGKSFLGKGKAPLMRIGEKLHSKGKTRPISELDSRNIHHRSSFISRRFTKPSLRHVFFKLGGTSLHATG